jgi:hypothetical protein
MFAVALAFGIAVPLGFWLRPHYPAIPERVFGAIVAVVLAGIALGAMRLLVGPLWPVRGQVTDLVERPHPDIRTGYEMTFEDFRRLVYEPSSQPVIAPLLKEWFGYDICGQGPVTVVRSQGGSVIALRVLHAEIQRDPPRQYTVYQRAMDLWR